MTDMMARLILEEVRAARAENAEVLRQLAGLATRKLSRKRQAKKVGVHRSTLWRRERKARAQINVKMPI